MPNSSGARAPKNDGRGKQAGHDKKKISNSGKKPPIKKDGPPKSALKNGVASQAEKKKKSQGYRRLLNEGDKEVEVPGGAVKLLDRIVYRFTGTVLQAIPCLKKVNEAMLFAEKLALQKTNGSFVNDDDYMKLKSLTEDIANEYLSETMGLDQNMSHKNHYDSAMKGLNEVLEFI